MGWFKKREQKKFFVDLKPSVSTFTMKDGSTHKISRTGYTEYMGPFGWSAITGESLLNEYVSDSKRTILKDDAGQLFPTSQILIIDTQVGSKNVWLSE